MQRTELLAFVALVLFSCTSQQLYAQTSVTINGQASTDAPTDFGVAAVGTMISSLQPLSLSVDSPPSGLSWTWSLSGVGTVASSGTSSASANIGFTAGGVQTFTITATGASSGSSTSMGASGTYRGQATIVAVTSLTVKSGVRIEEGKTLNATDFTIVTNPPGYESMVSLTPSLPLTLGGGGESVTLTATCGTSTATCSITVPMPYGSISFTSATSGTTGDTLTYQASETDAIGASYSFSGAASGTGGVLNDATPSATGTVSVDWTAVDLTTADSPTMDDDSDSTFSALAIPVRLTAIAYQRVESLSADVLSQDAIGILKDVRDSTVLGDTVKNLVRSKGACAPDADAPIAVSGSTANWETTPASTGANFSVEITYKATVGGERHQVLAAGIDYIVNPSVRVDASAPNITSIKKKSTNKVYDV
ncbi:MAG: hypothetical protein WCJ09_21675 [Planctomycetota bacterium]